MPTSPYNTSLRCSRSSPSGCRPTWTWASSSSGRTWHWAGRWYRKKFKKPWRRGEAHYLSTLQNKTGLLSLLVPSVSTVRRLLFLHFFHFNMFLESVVNELLVTFLCSKTETTHTEADDDHFPFLPPPPPLSSPSVKCCRCSLSLRKKREKIYSSVKGGVGSPPLHFTIAHIWKGGGDEEVTAVTDVHRWCLSQNLEVEDSGGGVDFPLTCMHDSFFDFFCPDACPPNCTALEYTPRTTTHGRNCLWSKPYELTSCTQPANMSSRATFHLQKKKKKYNPTAA